LSKAKIIHSKDIQQYLTLFRIEFNNEAGTWFRILWQKTLYFVQPSFIHKFKYNSGSRL